MAKKNTSKTDLVDALPYLMAPESFPPKSVCVVAGEDVYLRHEVRVALCLQLASGDEEGLGHTTYEGRDAELRDVLDALNERSLFGSQRQVVVVEDADSFVKQYRSQLEEALDKTAQDAILVLVVQSWPSNTRLAKAVAKTGLTIRCNAPQQGREKTAFFKQLNDWLIYSAKMQHDTQLQPAAVELLLEQLPTEVGILYQEVAKLALLVDPTSKTIDRKLVAEHVGGWRARKTWDMIDATVEGRGNDALLQLDRLIASGEEPHALLPQMASTLRRFAAAVTLYEHAERNRQRLSLKGALEQAGIPKFKLSVAEGQLRQLGRDRTSRMFQWLLAADLELKGYNSTKDRARRVIETLIVRLSRQAQPAQRVRKTSAGTR